MPIDISQPIIAIAINSILQILTNFQGLFDLAERFSINLIVILIVVRFIYFVKTKRKDYLFTYIIIAITVFFLCYLLESVKLQLGFALGLFAIFTIIRYRTSPIPITEMTYLFVVIGISVINALANHKVDYIPLIFTNLTIVLIIWLLENIFLKKHENRKTIIYEKIELIKPENYNLLIEDLKKRTGLNILKVEVGEINFLKDTALLNVYYIFPDNRINLADNKVEEKYNDTFDN